MSEHNITKYSVRHNIKIAISAVYVYALLGLSSGKWAEPRVLGYGLAFIICNLFAAVLLQVFGKEVSAAREIHKRDGEKYDTRLVMIYGLIAYNLMPVLAGLDIGRWHLTPAPDVFPWWGICIMVPGCAFIYGSMIRNKFFEGTVRIQKDRGHKVITTGFYRIVRHPGYFGVVLWELGGAIVLASVFAYISFVIVLGLFLYRTYREDNYLKQNLEGYREYARQVKSRLFPGFW